jgi:hypothetical protein
MGPPTTIGDPPIAISHRVLIIDPDTSAALRLQNELASAAGRGVWLWHERSLADALTELSVLPFELVLLAPRAGEGSWDETARAVRELAGDAAVVLYGDEVSGSTVLRLLGLPGEPASSS